MHAKIVEIPFNESHEEWRAIPGFAPFEASSLGRIRNTATNHIMAQRLTKNGYMMVLISAGCQKVTCCYVHRLVCAAFNGAREKQDVNHVNHSRSDNRIENLEWCSRKENMAHCRRAGRTLRGERNNGAKLSEAQVIEIRALAGKGLMQKDIATIYGVGNNTISRIVRGLRWNHVGGLHARSR